MRKLPAMLILATVLALPVLASAKTFVIPHVLERSGSALTQRNAMDTTLHFTYTSGLFSGIPGPGATVDLFLYDDGGAAMKGKDGKDVCAPCTYPLGHSARKTSVRIENLFKARGGMPKLTMTGFAIIQVGGPDPDGVNIQGFITNSHTSPFDLSVFGFEPQPLTAAP
jgi:hypothetical protein